MLYIFRTRYEALEVRGTSCDINDNEDHADATSNNHGRNKTSTHTRDDLAMDILLVMIVISTETLIIAMIILTTVILLILIKIAVILLVRRMLTRSIHM
jgi:hypothetical protein